MSFEGSHQGQKNTSEIIIADVAWLDLNPYYQSDTSSRFITKCIMNSLLYQDSDKTIWPHLVKSFTFLNDTHIRFVCREGIKWQTDSDGNFTNEYLDAKDIYFTYYVFNWYGASPFFPSIKSIQIINSTTIDFFIDANPHS